MAKASSPIGMLLRTVTPAQLLFCFVLFFLPWVELQCVPPPDNKAMSKDEAESMKKEIGFDTSKPFSIYSQSGLQIATGNVSLTSDGKKLSDAMKKGVGEGADLDPNSPTAKKNREKNKDKGDGTAPLLFLYPVALWVGIIAAAIPIPGMIRRILEAVCCLGAFSILGLQVAVGFPLENDAKRSADELKAFGSGKMPAPVPGPGQPKAATKTETKSEPDVIRVAWQIPLYLTFLFLLGAIVTAPADALAGSVSKSSKYSKKRKRPRDEYDDEAEENGEEEDEDDRPKTKKRRYEEDEDDRPRRKRRNEDYDEEEEERPRKKKVTSRADDDDEDDRPRKKRRDEEETLPPPPPKPAAPKPTTTGSKPGLPIPPAASAPKPPAPGGSKPGIAPAAPKPPAPAAPKPPGLTPNRPFGQPPPPPAPSAPNPFAFDEVDDKPKPKKKSSLWDDEDEDRPRKKRPRDDDDDDDDRPRKKRRRDDDD